MKVTELFLIPSSFLVAALGTADTNLHRAAVSVLGSVSDVLWLLAVRDAYRAITTDSPKAGEIPVRTRVLCWLPVTFGVGWIISTIIHFALWDRPLARF